MKLLICGRCGYDDYKLYRVDFRELAVVCVRCELRCAIVVHVDIGIDSRTDSQILVEKE